MANPANPIEQLDGIQYIPEGEQILTHDPTALMSVSEDIYIFQTRHKLSSIRDEIDSDSDSGAPQPTRRSQHRKPKRPFRSKSEAALNKSHPHPATSQSPPAYDIRRRHTSLQDPNSTKQDDPQSGGRRQKRREQRIIQQPRHRQQPHHQSQHHHSYHYPPRKHQLPHQVAAQRPHRSKHHRQPSHPPISPISHSPKTKSQNNSLNTGSVSSEASCTTIPGSNVTEEDLIQNSLSLGSSSLLEQSEFAKSNPGSSAPQLMRNRGSMSNRSNRLRPSHTEPSVSSMSGTGSFPRLNALYPDDLRRICEAGGFGRSHTRPSAGKRFGAGDLRSAHRSSPGISRRAVNNSLPTSRELDEQEVDFEQLKNLCIQVNECEVENTDNENSNDEGREVGMSYYKPSNSNSRSPVLR